MKITALIVTFNRLEKLKITMRKTLQEKFSNIIIVNNHSNDGTKEYLDSLDDERLIVKHQDENIGGAGGFYVGFQVALEESIAEWLVCYDDDAYPVEGTIGAFETLQIPDEISSVAAAVYLPNGEISTMNKVRINPFKNLATFYHTFVRKESIYIPSSVYREEKTIPIDASTFVGFFMRTSMIKKVGLPRTELFIYADDLIYTLGLTQKGYRHLLVPSLKFIHDCNTLVNENDVYTPTWKVYYTFRNRIEMYRVSSSWFYLPVALLQIPSWWKKKAHYENPKLYTSLLKTAIIDAFRGDFSKKHADILKIVAAYEQ